MEWLFDAAQVKKRCARVGSSLPWPHGNPTFSLWVLDPYWVFIHEGKGKVVAVVEMESPLHYSIYLNADSRLVLDALLVAAGAR